MEYGCRCGSIDRSRPLRFWLSGLNPERCHVRAKNPRGFLLCGVKTEVSLTKEATQKAIHRTRLITGGLNSVNSVSIKKRYWWERVCNTAQMDGEDSIHDPQGCRVAMSALGIA